MDLVRHTRGAIVVLVLGCAGVSFAAARSGASDNPASVRRDGSGHDAKAGRPVTASAVEGTLIVHEDWAGAHPVPRLLVLLPPSYAADSTRHFPVLYALDGQDLFDSARAAGGDEWTLDEIQARHPAGVPELLVVGIESGADALRAQSPPGAMPGARGDSLLAFLVDTVRPFVSAHYRTLPESERTLVFGAGSSALFAAYAAWRRSDVFGSALALGCPDVDAASMAWMATPPAHGRPWIWLEQRGSDKPRPSSTDLLAALQCCADVQMVVTGPESSRTQRLLAALLAWARR